MEIGWALFAGFDRTTECNGLRTLTDPADRAPLARTGGTDDRRPRRLRRGIDRVDGSDELDREAVLSAVATEVLSGAGWASRFR
jgi:hypothetical protein